MKFELTSDQRDFGDSLESLLAAADTVKAGRAWAAGDEPITSVPGFPIDWPHADSVAGWGGDRLVMYENTGGSWAIEWQTAWDTTTDAQEFEFRARELQALLDGVSSVSSVVQRPGPTVTVIVASDHGTLSLLSE